MATYASGLQQSTSEIHTYTVDYTNDLSTGVTVTAGTATHTPPSGSASTPTVTVSSPYLLVTLPAQSVIGVHYLDVLATFSNGDKSAVRLPVNIVYPSPTARSGMSDIIAEVRAMCDAGADDYQIAGVPYWTDAQLQKILDAHRTDLKWVEMYPIQEGSGDWLEYPVGYSNLEQTTGGTAIFFVQDTNGDTVSSANYTVDYDRGLVTFTADTDGVPYYVTGRAYDLNAAAADVWRRKQSHYHSAVNFSSDNHRVDNEKLYEHAKEMCEYYESLGKSGLVTMELYRGDLDVTE